MPAAAASSSAKLRSRSDESRPRLAAAERGIDLLYFWSDEASEVEGAIRFNLKASALRVPAADYATAAAHGGAVAAALDDITGTVLRSTHTLLAVTSELKVSYVRPAPLYRTLRFSAKVDEVRAGGRRVLTSAQIVDDDGEPVAVGRAVMVDLAVPAAPRASAGGGGHGSPAQPSSPLANRRPGAA